MKTAHIVAQNPKKEKCYKIRDKKRIRDIIQ